MDYSNLNLSLIRNGNAYDVLITADKAYMEEFGEEFGTLIEADEGGRTSLRAHLKTKYPDKPLNTGRIMLSGLVVGTFPINPGISAPGAAGLTHNYSIEPRQKKYQSYCVLPGESLASIAEKFHTTEDRLITLNHMDTGVYVGQKINVPTST